MWQAESSREQMAHSQRAQTTLRDGVDAGNSLSGYLLPPPDAGPGQGCSVPGRAGSCSFPWGGCDLGQKHQLPPWLWSGRDRTESKDGGHVHASLLLLGPPSSYETLEVLLRWYSPQRQLPGPPSQVRNGSIKQIENRTRYLRVQGFGGFSPYSSPCIISHCFNLL